VDPDPDADPDPAIFFFDLQEANKKLFKGTFTSFFKDKSPKKVTKQ
jgi:hypothetical protein